MHPTVYPLMRMNHNLVNGKKTRKEMGKLSDYHITWKDFKIYIK